MNRHTRRAQSGEQRGAAAVEFALVAVPVLMLLFGIISYGYLLSFRQAISQAAAEGARSAAIWHEPYDAAQHGDRTDRARASIGEAIDSYGVDCDDPLVTCAVEFEPCDDQTCAEVTVSYPYGEHPLLPQLPFVPLPDHLAYTTEVRVT